MKQYILLLLAGLCLPAAAQVVGKSKGVVVEKLSWTEARKLLLDTTIVVIPLGAEAKEHGPHLQLNNDWIIADYLGHRIVRDQAVVLYPTVNYNFYPSFLEYAGSTSLRIETSYSMIVDICRVIAAHGPRKFYILNTGVSTLAPLKIAKDILAHQGIRMDYTDILHVAGDAEKKVRQESAGTHADEIETSMMLYIAPATVDMKKAAKDIPQNDSPGPLSLDPASPRYSPTGIYGDATLATREKGQIVVEAMVKGINAEIESLRRAGVQVPARVLGGSFAGTYQLTPDEQLVVTAENERLIASVKSRRLTLLPQSSNSFTAGERGRIVFFPDENGNYNLVYFSWEGADYLGRRK